MREPLLHSLDSITTIRRLVAFYVDEHNRALPHAAFRGQTPDEMCFGSGDAVPIDLRSRAAAARGARVEANRSAVSAHIKQGFFLTDGGYEYTLIIRAVALSVAFTGPGAFSLDHALGLRFAGTVYGIGALAIAAMGVASQLAGRELTVASPVHS